MEDLEFLKKFDDMKFFALLLAALLFGGTAAAQTTPPTFNGATTKIFLSRLTAQAKLVAIEKKYPYEELTELNCVAFLVDTTGQVSQWRFRDNTCKGRDSVGYAPASEATRRLLTEAFDNMEGEWQPARRGDRKVRFTVNLVVRLPVKAIAQALDPDPLLFMEQDPGESFVPWFRPRVRYDERFAKVEGLVHVRFFVEADGSVTIDEVVESPDEKLTKEVLRVIRNSRGKWTPRKVDGVAQRSAYELRMNYGKQ